MSDPLYRNPTPKMNAIIANSIVSMIGGKCQPLFKITTPIDIAPNVSKKLFLLAEILLMDTL